MAWAAHLSAPAVVVPTPTANSINYAVALNSALKLLTFSQLWVRVPLVVDLGPNDDHLVRTGSGAAACPGQTLLPPPPPGSSSRTAG